MIPSCSTWLFQSTQVRVAGGTTHVIVSHRPNLSERKYSDAATLCFGEQCASSLTFAMKLRQYVAILVSGSAQDHDRTVSTGLLELSRTCQGYRASTYTTVAMGSFARCEPHILSSCFLSFTFSV